MKKFIISEVLDIKTNKRSEEFGYRVGRECFIDESNIKKGKSLLVRYLNGSLFYTSLVTEISKTYTELYVKTKNRIYKFNYIEESR